MAGFLGLADLFVGRHFDREVIVLCVRWYLRFKLSYRDLVEMMAERGLSMVHRDAVLNVEALANPQCLDAISRHPALRPSAQPAARDVGEVPLEEQLRAIWETAFG